jgi:hypothetical protein
VHVFFPKPKDTVEKISVIKTSLANTCRYLKFVTLIQEAADHIAQLVYAGHIFANYCFLELLQNGEELPVITQNLFYDIFSIFTGQGKHCSDSIKKDFKIFCQSISHTQSRSKRRVHSVLKRESCGTMQNRDMNSALNICGIFVYKSKHGNESSSKD